MKSSYLILSLMLSICFFSCDTKHKVESVEILANFEKGKSRRYLNICLVDELGYTGLYLNLKFETKDGYILEFNDEIFTHSNIDKKCFKLFTNLFLHRHSSEYDKKGLKSIYKGNVKKLDIKLVSSTSKNILSQQTFENL